jgi:hypothetical protein
MNTEQLLRDTFAAHESESPDADAAWRRLDAQLNGPPASGTAPRRRRAALVGMGAAASVVGVVTAGILVAGPHRPTADPGGERTAAGPSATAGGWARISGSARPSVLAVRDYLTVGPGWLPPGQAVQIWGSRGPEQSREYQIGPTSTGTDLALAVQTGRLDTFYKRGGTKRDLSIAGRPAREWSGPDFYHLEVQRPAGQVLWVDLKSPSESQAQLRAYGRHVGRSMRYDRHDTLRPEFRFSYLPAGSSVYAVSVDNLGATTYELRTARTHSIDQATVESNEIGKWPTRAGRRVQGHPTRVVDASPAGSSSAPKPQPKPILIVEDATHGHDIVLTGGWGATTLAQLYRIADGLVLPR